MPSSRPRSRTLIRYTFDPLNRLVVSDPTDLLHPKRIVEGHVSLDTSNRLVYEVDSSEGAEGRPGPQTVKLDGTWSLTHDHRLALTLHETTQQDRQTVYLKGALVKAEDHALIFALRQSESADLTSAQRLSLSGRWQADAKNRLNFLVEKADGSEDRLTLQGGWGIGPHHELIYRYRELVGARHLAQEHTLIFEGAWDITKSDRLVYRVAGSADSSFEFRASLQSPSLIARDRRIVYEVGVGLSGGRAQRERVTLFGRWKLNRDLSVSFEIPYADGRVQAIRFEGTYALSPRDRIAVALQNSQREGLGLTVTFTKDVVPDTSLYLRLQKDAQEGSVVGGVQVRF